MFYISDSTKLTVTSLSLTTECNFSCPYCYNKNTHTHLSLNKIKQLFSKIETEQITIGGGEPGLNPEFRDIIKYLALNIKPVNLAVTTNGTTLLMYYDVLNKHCQSIALSYHKNDLFRIALHYLKHLDAQVKCLNIIIDDIDNYLLHLLHKYKDNYTHINVIRMFDTKTKTFKKYDIKMLSNTLAQLKQFNKVIYMSSSWFDNKHNDISYVHITAKGEIVDSSYFKNPVDIDEIMSNLKKAA